MSDQEAPFRTQALALGGSKIKTPTSFAASDGRPMGAGSAKALAQPLAQPAFMREGATPSTKRQSPFEARAK